MTAGQMAGTRRAAAALALAGAIAAGAAAVPQARAATVVPVRVNTGGVSHVRGTSAQLNGVLLAQGVSASVFFEYGPNGFPAPAGAKSYGSKTKPLSIAASNPPKAVKVGQLVNGLLPGYHYRICAVYTAPGETTPKPAICGKDKAFSGGKVNALKFHLPKGKEERLTAIYGGSFELAGSLTGKNDAGHGLSLQATPFPYTEPFTPLGANILTSRTGSFVFKIARVTQDTQMRIATADPHPVYSPVVTLHVTPRFTLHVRSGGHGIYRLYGTVAPARPGAPLTIQQLVPRKAQSKKEGPAGHSVGTTILRRATKSLSRFSVIVHLSGSFRYRAFVRLPKGTIESGHSGNVLIKAPKAKPGVKRHRKR
jgi:hypothetical protein